MEIDLTQEQSRYELNQALALRALNSALESYLTIDGTGFVDPREALLGPDGEMWDAVGSAGSRIGGLTWPIYRNERELTRMRDECRMLGHCNPFARNGHENRISYLVGWGHTYTVESKPDADATPAQIAEVKAAIDAFLKANTWGNRQQEILLRFDRDGDVFLRYFAPPDGILRVRFIEPEMIRAPKDAKPNQSYGVETDPLDIETVLAYHLAIDDQGNTAPLDPVEVQHRKANVDSSCKRGQPLFYPVRQYLARANKTLVNMSTVSGIQAAIAMIRKWQGATKAGVQSLLTNKADATVTTSNGQTHNFERFPPGTILNAPAGAEYDFPAQGIDPSKHIAGIQAELRAVASFLVMPEFMLTSDASNANYASTLVSEGPAVKMFERLQQQQILWDREVLEKALALAVSVGALSQQAVDATEICIEPPTVHVRDRLKEAQTAQIEMTLGVLSPQTATAEAGRDYETEQNNIETHQERLGVPLNPIVMPGQIPEPKPEPKPGALNGDTET